MDNIIEREKDSLWHWKGQTDYVDSWFLMKTPYPMLLIIIIYLLFVLKFGPEYMRSRQPYKLQNALVSYNIFQVIFSVFLVYNGVYFTMKYGLLNRNCIVDNEDTRKELLSRSYWYVIAKITELTDTIFFVLRKKQNQVSFLHVYHHTITLIISWLLLKYTRTDDLVFVGTLNSIVHIFMYGYYGLSVFPQIAKHLWWKKYLTSLQLIQFIMVLAYIPINTIISQCKPSLIKVFAVTFNGLLFMYLFTDFYRQSYLQKNPVTNKTVLEKNDRRATCDKEDSKKFK